jgi:hypothetical protein
MPCLSCCDVYGMQVCEYLDLVRVCFSILTGKAIVHGSFASDWSWCLFIDEHDPPTPFCFPNEIHKIVLHLTGLLKGDFVVAPRRASMGDDSHSGLDGLEQRVFCESSAGSQMMIRCIHNRDMLS